MFGFLLKVAFSSQRHPQAELSAIFLSTYRSSREIRAYPASVWKVLCDF